MAKKEDGMETGDESEIENPEEDAFDKFYTRKSSNKSTPFFVFLWSYLPWHMWGHLSAFFLTHACIACALGVFACNYGMEELVCSWLGLCGFASCIVGCSNIQEYGQMKDAAERMEAELQSMRLLMEKYELENDLLKETMVQLEEQSEALQAESKKLEMFTENLKNTTTEFETNIRCFKRERLQLAATFENIDKIVNSLSDKEADLQKRTIALQRELKKLRTHNKTIAGIYDEIVLEHQKVKDTNARMAEQIEMFENINKKCIDQQDVLKKTLHGNTEGMKTMMQNYEILFMQEIAHSAEFVDGQAGMTIEKFEEFVKRIPSNIQYPEDRLISLFEEKCDENGICNNEAMHLIITQLVKAKAGVPGALLSSDEIVGSVEPSAMVDL